MAEQKDAQVQALTELREASAEFEAGESELERRRQRLHAAIVAALKLDLGPSAIEREAPYDRQHIDRIRRAAGIPAKRRPTVRRVPEDQDAGSEITEN